MCDLGPLLSVWAAFSLFLLKGERLDWLRGATGFWSQANLNLAVLAYSKFKMVNWYLNLNGDLKDCICISAP